MLPATSPDLCGLSRSRRPAAARGSSLPVAGPFMHRRSSRRRWASGRGAY